mgnify:CR=1 FL=1
MPPQELRLRLARGHLVGSTVDALGAFSEVGPLVTMAPHTMAPHTMAALTMAALTMAALTMAALTMALLTMAAHTMATPLWQVGVRCGVLRQELRIEYAGEEGQDAGGLRRQFFDLFSTELAQSPLWTQTAAGGLRPADSAVRRGGAAAAAALRSHMETAGRVCGMALYQELHSARATSSVHHLLAAAGGEANQAPNLLGTAFARYFVRAVQHDPPSSLAELQAELL